MEMSGEKLSQQKDSINYRRPSERAARFILGITGFLRDMFTAPIVEIPRGKVIEHMGSVLPVGKMIQYPHILLVEDNPNSADEFTKLIKDFYVFGMVTIFVAHTYEAALTFFKNENIDLVIMDADLDDDDGDGSILTRIFLTENPDLIILANSSRKISNLKLTGFGASETLDKRPEKLRSWLLIKDPVGSKG